MLFWEQEREKLVEWWHTISIKEMATYLFSALFLLFIIYLYYYCLGVSGLSNWYRFGRNSAECFLLLFLTELMTRKSLLHPFWRIGYIPFFGWMMIFPYVLIHAVNGMKDPTFNHLSPYFLTSIASLLLIFFIMNVICRVVMGRKLAAFICLLPIAFFSLSAFVFLTHYEYMGIMMSARELFFAFYDPLRWFHRIVLPHIGGLRLTCMAIALLAYFVLYYRWIYTSAYHLDEKWQSKARTPYSLIHRILQFLVFIGCAWLLIRWASECFPLHDLENIRQYKDYIDFVNSSRF